MRWANEMNTPICDFVRSYRDSGTVRAHMPGHKGRGILGCEGLDITEISGADSLYEAAGIIAESEGNASEIFGCPTFYAAEGSSQCIRAMVYLAALDAKKKGRMPRIAAARNVHKTFLTAAALLDVEVAWLYGGSSYLSCSITPEGLDAFLTENPATAVYLTSPDYLGAVQDIGALGQVAHRHGALLLVDGAHGAYLKFLPRSSHPVDLGADLCCASAHKTLPVLTGGAYLHIADGSLAAQAKNALALFGSTSPSYLILQSLDGINPYLVEEFPLKLREFTGRVEEMKQKLTEFGYTQCSAEPLKVTLATKTHGYTGMELAAILREKGIECEFADPDYLVLMPSPVMGEGELSTIEGALLAIPPRMPILSEPPRLIPGHQALSIRQAMLSPAETVPVEQCAGRILASPSVGCPPAVPIAVCGEVLSGETLEAFRYYGIEKITVVI